MRDMMAKLKLTVNETKTRVCEAAGREVRLSGVHVWSLLLAENGTGLSGHGSVEEAGDPHLSTRSATRPDGTRPSWITETVVDETQPDDERLGQLLLSGSSQQSLSGGGTTCL